MLAGVSCFPLSPLGLFPCCCHLLWAMPSFLFQPLLSFTSGSLFFKSCMPADVCRLSRVRSQPPVPSSLTPLLPQHPLLALSPGDTLSASLCAFKFPLTPSLHHLLLCVKYPRNTEVIQQYLSSRCTVAYC